MRARPSVTMNSNQKADSMGDKSPKALNKNKKQEKAVKDRKKADATSKSLLQSALGKSKT